jgi:predicted dehydrogenase
LQQTYTAVGAEGAIELPHDAFIPWEKDAVFVVRGKNDEVGQEHIVDGEDEYQRMVEFFSDVVQGNADSDLYLEESVSNMKILDALAKSAKTGRAVQVNGDY